MMIRGLDNFLKMATVDSELHSELRILTLPDLLHAGAYQFEIISLTQCL